SNENRSNENGLRPSLVPRRLRKEGEGKRGEDAPPGISDVSYSLSAFVALDDDVAHSALGPDAEEDRTFGLPQRLGCFADRPDRLAIDFEEDVPFPQCGTEGGRARFNGDDDQSVQ